MDEEELKRCDDCKNCTHHYADGYVFRDWSGSYQGDPKDLPKVPDRKMFWTYMICSKNAKKLTYLNLDSKCEAFSKK